MGGVDSERILTGLLSEIFLVEVYWVSVGCGSCLVGIVEGFGLEGKLPIKWGESEQ